MLPSKKYYLIKKVVKCLYGSYEFKHKLDAYVGKHQYRSCLQNLLKKSNKFSSSIKFLFEKLSIKNDFKTDILMQGKLAIFFQLNTNK